MAKRSLPASVEVCGAMWPIILSDRILSDGADVYGICDTDNQCIIIARAVDGEAVDHDTMLEGIAHERAHAMLHCIGEAFAEAAELTRKRKGK